MTESAHIEFYRRILEACEAEHTELTQIFQILDTKAQATAAIAGVFIAAVFAFSEDFGRGIIIPSLILLCVGVTLLVASVVTAVLGMWVRSVLTRPTAEFVRQLTMDLIAKEGGAPSNARLPGFYGDQVQEWLPSLQRLRAVLAKKSRLVTASQSLLTIASVIAAILSVAYLLT